MNSRYSSLQFTDRKISSLWCAREARGQGSRAATSPSHVSKVTILAKMAAPAFTNQYSETLFGCFEDIPTCAYGFFCTPCLVGQSAEDANQGKCFDTTCCLLAWNCIPWCGGFIAACKTAEIMNKVSAKFALPHVSRPHVPRLSHL